MPNASYTLWWVFVAGLLAVLVLVTGLGAAMIVSQHQRNTLRRRFARRLVDAHEEERARIAREVHDDAIQRLALIAQDIDRVAAGPGGNGGIPPTVTLKGIREEVRDLSDTLRQLAHRLHPSGLEHLALGAALEQLADEFRQGGGLEVSLHVSRDDAEGLPKPINLALYRIAQEALHNVAKHAEARAVTVRVQRTAAGIELTIVDDGRGFQVGRRSEGLGLVSMAERAALVGGSLKIESRPGVGTAVRALLPTSLRKHEGAATAAG
ncbi:MAG: sensor histidine kinase [Gemmatimonadales bacterium]